MNGENKTESSPLTIEAYQNIFRNMREVMAIFEILRDENGNAEDMVIKDVNEAYVQYIGIPRKKAVNQRASLIYGPEFVNQYFNLVKSDSEIGTGKQFETYFPPLDKYYLTTLFKIGKDLYATLGVDITRRVTLEKELEKERANLELKVQERTKELLESERKLTEAQRIAHLGNWELDLKTDDLWFSDEVYNIFGFNPEEFTLGLDLQKLKITYDVLLNMIVHPDDRELLDKSFKEALNGKPYNIDHRVILPDGEERIVHEQAELIYENGIPVKMSGTTQDITDRKRTEKRLKKLIEELKRSNEELKQFAYVASHDLQEPLRTIASFTQLLEIRYKGKFDSDADEFMDYIVEAAKRMQNLINDLLQYSKVMKDRCEFKSVDMDIVLKEALFNLRGAINETKAEIIHDPLPKVVADKNQLIQLFQNIIANSIKFRREDEPPRIHISAKKNTQKDEYIFSIADNGIGMEQQYADRIFKIFQRLHTMEEYDGTGIGLAISKRIIERHNGRIWVESSLGKGSTFYFTLPL
ncbi:sensor histidine kinase [Methanobacterium oryzae]|uniref:sensor histidine kinase n=1 Tax=Methanobacterium oryzae TaxID=69540 RepID=UPI003D1B022A